MKEIAKQLLRINAVKFNPNPRESFEFSSGIKSPIYCDNRSAYGDVDASIAIDNALQKVVNDVWDAYDSHASVVIVGVATGAIGWGYGVANYLGAPFAYVRAGRDDHEKKIEGYKLGPDDKVIIVEDLIATGTSSLAALSAVRETGAEVLGMVAIMTYGWPQTAESFEKAEVPVYTLTNYQELVDVATRMKYFSEEEGALLQQWYIAPENWGQ